MRYVALALAAALLGWVGYLLIVTAQSDWDTLPTGAVATVIAALIALQSVESWNERRTRESQASLRAHREEIYEKLMRHMVGVFKGGTSDDELVALRAAVAVWADRAVIDRLHDWNEATYEIMQRSNGVMTLTEKADLQRRLGEMALAVRVDLRLDRGRDEPPAEQITAMIFDDRKVIREQLAEQGS